jgi:hypothetical protein
VSNASFSNISAISWQPVLVVEEAGVPGENHQNLMILIKNIFCDNELLLNIFLKYLYLESKLNVYLTR